MPVFAYPWAGVLPWPLLSDGRTTGSARLTDAIFTGVASIVGATVLYTPALAASGPAALPATTGASTRSSSSRRCRPGPPRAGARACRAALRDGGAVLVADENVADRLTAPGDELERMMYGWSVSHCLPASRVETGSSELGTVLRAGTVAELASQAGFDVDVLDVDAGLLRLYRLS